MQPLTRWCYLGSHAGAFFCACSLLSLKRSLVLAKASCKLKLYASCMQAVCKLRVHAMPAEMGRTGGGWAGHLLGCSGRKPTSAVVLLTPIPSQLPEGCPEARLLEGQLSTADSCCSHSCPHRHMATMSLVTGIVCCSRVQGRHVQARPMFLYTKQARPEDRKLSEEGGVILAALRPLLLLVPAGVGAWGRGRSLRRRGRRG